MRNCGMNTTVSGCDRRWSTFMTTEMNLEFPKSYQQMTIHSFSKDPVSL
jgi:hypothetical protein